MIIPDWLVSGFAVFGFICMWCIVIGFSASRFMQFSMESEVDVENNKLPITSSDPIAVELLNALGMPENCISLRVVAKPHRPLMVLTASYLTVSDAIKATTILKKYGLTFTELQEPKS